MHPVEPNAKYCSRRRIVTLHSHPPFVGGLAHPATSGLFVAERVYNLKCADPGKIALGSGDQHTFMGESSGRDDRIGEFHPGDLEDVGRLVVETIEASHAPVYPREAIDYFLAYHTKEQILEDADRGCTLVLAPDGRIVGTGTLLGSTIKRVFVPPSRRRRGYGALLMQALEREALDRGIGRVDLSASLPSKRFYDMLGYTTSAMDPILLSPAPETNKKPYLNRRRSIPITGARTLP